MVGGDFVMGSVTRHHAGTYQCVTRDDYGLEPVTKEVELFVECKSYQLVENIDQEWPGYSENA